MKKKKSKSSRKKIKQHAKESIEKHAASNRADYINRSLKFDDEIRLDPEYLDVSNRIVDEMLDERGKRYTNLRQKYRDCEILIGNMIYAHLLGKTVRISLNRNDYIASLRRPVSYFLLDIVRYLSREKIGLVKLYRGFFDRDRDRGKMSRLAVTERFHDRISLLPAIQPIWFESSTHVLILRDDTKKNIEYKHTPWANKQIKFIKKLNAMHAKHKVEYEHRDGRLITINPNLHAVYSDGSWQKGGRLYTGTNGYQGLNKEERATILIDNDATVEKDYSGMHPSLLYAWAGMSCVEDPYTVLLKNQSDTLRTCFKIALLAILNCQSEIKAARAISKKLYLDSPVYCKALHERGLKTSQLLGLFKDAYPELKKYFFTGVGLKLQKQESEIVRIVLCEFLQKNRVCLPMHDSLIVKKQYGSALVTSMKGAYRSVVGQECKVK